MRNIDVRAAKGGHGNRIALLLQTWNLQKWVFSGWLERSILSGIEHLVIQEQVHKRVIDWQEVPFLLEWHRQIGIWRQRELDRQANERERSATLLQAWVRGRAVRNAAPVMTSDAQSLAEAVSELFSSNAPVVQLPPSKSLEDGVHDIFQPISKAMSPFSPVRTQEWSNLITCLKPHDFDAYSELVSDCTLAGLQENKSAQRHQVKDTVSRRTMDRRLAKLSASCQDKEMTYILESRERAHLQVLVYVHANSWVNFAFLQS